MPSSFEDRKTPGVYIDELNAFPPGIVGVPTSVPAFVGYTEKSTIGGKSVYLTPIKISSMADYESIFGSAPTTKFKIDKVEESEDSDLMVKGAQDENIYYDVRKRKSDRGYLLYHSLQLFFHNGGGECWVVSVGSYDNAIKAGDFLAGLQTLEGVSGLTALVIPDAVRLDQDDFGKVARAMLVQCGNQEDRTAILDVWGADTLSDKNINTKLTPLIESFQKLVGDQYLNYGAAYFPFLATSFVGIGDIGLENFKPKQLMRVLKQSAESRFADRAPEFQDKVNEMIEKIATVEPWETSILNTNLLNTLPVLSHIYSIAATELNVIPPSGAVAGVYTLNDQTWGVNHAPANSALVSVVSPTVNLNDRQQAELNAPLNGKAVDVIRQFQGRGTLIWGARTLDGNSNDWRYIQVRRTIIYIEQSIKNALAPFVFAANDSKTWSTIVSSISGFLSGFWVQGGLIGTTASEAFRVECGLGSTMTSEDIQNGNLIVQIYVALTRPAEFIGIEIVQHMQS